KTCGPFPWAKQLEAGGHAPVHERGFFQIAEAAIIQIAAINAQRDPVMTENHFARGLGVDRVGVVHQSGLEQAAQVNGGPYQHNKKDEKIASWRGRVGSRDVKERLRRSLGMHERIHYMRRHEQLLVVPWSHSVAVTGA